MAERILDLPKTSDYIDIMQTEGQPGPESQPHRIEGFESRLKHMDSLSFNNLSSANNEWLTKRGQTPEDLKGGIAKIGIPVDNVKRLVASENTRENAYTLGSFALGGGEKGTMTIYKLRGEIPLIAQIGVDAHELTHATSPFLEENSELYGSNEAREQAKQHAIGVANQTVATRVFLSGYHKYHYDLLMDARGQHEMGKITSEELKSSEWLFAEETNAIMVQMRFENPRHLAEVEKAQHESLKRRQRGGENDLPKAVNLISHKNDRGEVILDGVDKTLVSLISEVSNQQELDAHVRDVRTYYAQQDRGKDSHKIRETMDSRDTFVRRKKRKKKKRLPDGRIIEISVEEAA